MKDYLIVSPVFPYRGGIANFAEMLFKVLEKHDDAGLINFKRQYPAILFPGKSQYEEDTTKNIQSERLIDSINPVNWKLVGSELKKRSPKYLIFNFWLPFFAPAFGVISKMVKKNGVTKIVSVCHNVLPHEKRPGDKALTKYFFKHVDYFVTMSDSVTKSLLELFPQAKTKQLFHPVYSNFGEPISKTEALDKLKLPKKNTLLFFGFIRDYKGLDVLLEAIALIKNQLDFQLIVAGEFYTDPKPYMDIIKKNKLEQYVYLFDEFIPSDEVKNYFCAADVVMLPYKSATQSGIVQISNNFYKPVIATKVGGLGEIIKDNYNGFVIEPNNPRQMADAIIRFFAEANSEEMSANVKKEVEKFSWDVFAEELVTFINEPGV